MSKTSSFVLLSLLPVLVSASNDWSIPCVYGSCSYDIPASDSSMAGSMTVSGTSTAISDITSAAGWQILNCTSDASAQDIQMVCPDDEAPCSHLFENGAEHTIVRLPQNCGASPFARVVQAGPSDDQSLPANISSRFARRDGTTPTVYSLSFDTSFDQVPASQHGNVSLFVYGSTIPGFNGNATIAPARLRRHSRRGKLNRRNPFSSILGDFNKTDSTNLPPIKIDQKFNLFNTTLSCSANEQAKISVDIDAKINAQVTLGVVLAGSLIPPKVDEFGLYANVGANLDGSLTIDANIAGQLDTGKIPILPPIGLPGLDIPEILTIGPSFEIDAEATANIDLDVDMTVDLAYNVTDLQLFFPPSAGQSSSAKAVPQSTPLKLSASPDISSNATLEAHLIPTLNFGVNALGGLASATIFLDVDTFAALDLGLEASASASIDTTGAKGASAQVGGCVDVNGGVSINAGAEGSFFDLFDDSTQIPLFSKDFDIFKKCFSDSASTTDSASLSATSTTSYGYSMDSSSAYLSSAALSYSSISASGESSQYTSSASAIYSIQTSSYEYSASAIAAQSLASTEISSTVYGSASAMSSASASFSATSASASASETASSAAATASVSAYKRSGRSLKSRGTSVKSSKPDFQCLSGDIAAAESVVDQVVSAANFSS